MKINFNKVADLLEATGRIEINFETYEKQGEKYISGALTFTKEEVLEEAKKAKYITVDTVSFTNEWDVLIERDRERPLVYTCLWDKENNKGDFCIRNIRTEKETSIKNLSEEAFRNVARFME